MARCGEVAGPVWGEDLGALESLSFSSPEPRLNLAACAARRIADVAVGSKLQVQVRLRRGRGGGFGKHTGHVEKHVRPAAPDVPEDSPSARRP